MSCADCPLALRLLARETDGRRLRRVTLGVELSSTGDVQGPRMADLRVRANRSAKLVSASAGVSVRNADRELYVDPATGNPWRLHPDGSYQFVVHGLASSKRLEPGRVLTLEFELDTLGPASFWLERHEQTLAPASVDAALQVSPYEQAVLVTR